MPTEHRLKSWPQYFADVRSGIKRAEIRFNDRDFQRGDLLILEEFVPLDGADEITDHPSGHYTGFIEVREVVDVLSASIGLKRGYVILSMRDGPQGYLVQGRVMPKPSGTPPVAYVKRTQQTDGRIVDRLVSDKPLTAHERELLVILAEECMEVGIQISKLLRFGRVGVDRSVDPSTRYDNIELLGYELGDLQHMINAVQACELVPHAAVKAGERRKVEKLGRYLQAKRDDASCSAQPGAASRG